MAILVGPCASNDDFYDVLSSWTMKYTACMALIRSSVEGGCVRAGPSLCLALVGETRHEKRRRDELRSCPTCFPRSLTPPRRQIGWGTLRLQGSEHGMISSTI